ncbi:hypothetical protein AJ80_07619 [Polytolypa hystricis UAMH7299]|uniref:Xylanolytic transcriptional activator regulatory domain-containing protein n=1 Tax=Polytolypa hystricis (strain UAMH7299) TaxID=1447883 RepID=A0A2B7XLT5_POLH7|nr:hypothetical protein AJ80_07619 [Polytolypa hystricis UAMH7299]
MDDRLGRIESALQGILPLLNSLTAPSQLLSLQPQPQSTNLGSSLGDDMMTHGRHGRSPTPAGPLQTLFPPAHTLLFAADVYFRFCHNQPYSLFHEASLRQRLASGQIPAHLAWAVLAAARRFSTLPDLSESISNDPMSLVRLSWGCLKLPWDGAKSDEEAVQVIQTIVLLVNIEHPAGHCASAFMKLGFALRVALHSRLHMEPEAELSTIFKEERKRTFWSVYLQDKLISLSRERSPVLRDELCRIRLACSEAAFREGREEDCPTLDCFIGERLDESAVEKCCPLALIAVMSSALNRASQYALHENRYSELGVPWSPSSPYTSSSASLLQLEVHFGLSEPAAEMMKRNCFTNQAADQHITGSFIYAKALFHLAHCLLHHPFLLHQRLQRLKQRAPMSFAKTAWEVCRTHAKALTGLKDMRSHNVLILPSLYGYCMMIAGTIHALSLGDDKPSIKDEASLHFKYAIEFLHDLSRYWGHAALMATRLERFRQTVEGHRFLTDGRTPLIGQPNVDFMWQSVDYILLSTPTRPGSPRIEEDTGGFDFDFSPSQLFDFDGLTSLTSLNQPSELHS